MVSRKWQTSADGRTIRASGSRHGGIGMHSSASAKNSDNPDGQMETKNGEWD